MMIIGLTGGIGSGKSTVSRLFAELGVPVIDTDEIAHALSQPGQPGALLVGQLFGPEFLTASGAIDRPRLREHVFSSPAEKQRLEQAFHPLIRQAALQQLSALPTNTPYTLLVVPLLFETAAYQDVITRSLVVDCAESGQIDRVKQRSQLSDAQIQTIMAAQCPRNERLTRANDVIVNDGEMTQLTDKVKVLHEVYLQASESE